MKLSTSAPEFVGSVSGCKLSMFCSIFYYLFFLIESQIFIPEVSVDDCISVNNESGRCVPLRACPYFVDVLKFRPILKSSLRVLSTLTCGFDEDDPRICCPLDEVREPKMFRNLMETQYPVRSKYHEKFYSYKGHPNFPLLPTYEECGHQAAHVTRIFGGKIAFRGQFPFMALIAYKNDSRSNRTEVFCGASILNKRYVLTAAHCMKKISGLIPMQVHLGEYDTKTNPDCLNKFDTECTYVQIYNIEESIPHPAYDYAAGSNLDNDIALIRVDRDIEFDDLSQPVCLPLFVDYNLTTVSKEFNKIKDAIVTGWGRQGPDGTPSSVLLFAKVPIVLNELCEIDYYQYSKVTAFQICAGGMNVDSCSGDSGGPLLVMHKISSPPYRKLIQVGITSYGTSYCGRGVPSVYTRLTSYLPWILDTLRS